jgi:hypothetical protein
MHSVTRGDPRSMSAEQSSRRSDEVGPDEAVAVGPCEALVLRRLCAVGAYRPGSCRAKRVSVVARGLGGRSRLRPDGARGRGLTSRETGAVNSQRFLPLRRLMRSTTVVLGERFSLPFVRNRPVIIDRTRLPGPAPRSRSDSFLAIAGVYHADQQSGPSTRGREAGGADLVVSVREIPALKPVQSSGSEHPVAVNMLSPSSGPRSDVGRGP